MSEWKGTEIGLIPPDWKIKTLDKYIKKGRGICYGVVQPGFHDENGIPIIRVNNLKEGRIIADDVLKVSAGIESKYSRSRLRGGEILISLVGNVGEIVIVDSRYKGWNIARAVGVVPINDDIDKEWLKYWLQSSQVKHYISTHCNTTVQITLNLKDVSELPILEPSLEEQKLIASIPSVLDRKIENLRKQNETLEQIAQTLFKHWFVDFEFPNDEGKPYKSSGGEMVRSELGEIPVGWRVVKMEEIADRISMGPFGSRIKIDNFVNSGVPVIRGGNLVNGFNEAGFVYLTEEKADDLKSSNAFSEDIIFTHRGTLGQVGFIPTHSQYPRYIVSQSQMLLGINKKIASPRFIYRFFCSQVGLNAILVNTNTTGVPSIGRPTTTLKSIQTTLPEGKVMRQFDSLMKSIDFKKDANNKQIQTLVQSRDALLPKIMTGQISVI
jgi:type I restriction enzyme, S subunit